MRETNFLIENNARHVWHPMAHPAEMMANPPKIIQGGEGVEISDIHGKKVLDGVGGLWNVNLGYSCDPVKKAIRDQMEELPYYSSFRGTTNSPMIELSYELSEWFKPEGMVRSFFTSGGSDSVETCLRLRAAISQGQWPGRTYEVHRAEKKAITARILAARRSTAIPISVAITNPFCPACHICQRHSPIANPFGTTDGAIIAKQIAALFEDEIAFQGADTIAALIMEPVLGAGGVIVPHETFMPLMRAICDKHGILLIADEVITAFGRTGAWSGSRLWGVQPDLMATAKAITNGYFPFGAVMISQKLADAFESNKNAFGSIGHGYTYSGHPVGAAAALATLKETKRLNVAENAGARGKELKAGLLSLQEKHELVGDVRGIGLMCALELVSDRATKAAASKDTIAKVYETAFEAGVMVRTSGSNIILSPPLIITLGDVERIVSALDAGLSAAK